MDTRRKRTGWLLALAAGLTFPAWVSAQPGAGSPSAAPAPGPVHLVEKPLRFGVALGLNSATVAFDDDSGGGEFITNRTGIALTGFLSYKVSPSFSVEPGIRYSQRGFGFKFDEGETNISVEFDYVDVPVLGVGRFAVAPNAHVRAFGGAYLGVNVKAEDADGDDFGDEVADTDAGLILGGGVDINIGVPLLIIDVRYEIGLTNLVTNDDDGVVKNRVFSLNGGIAF